MIRHLTSSGVVLHNNNVLLIEHKKLGLWLYPGGHLNPDEDPAEAVVREIHEEVGIDVEIISEDRFAHPDVGVIPSPFTILVEEVRDAKVGVHQHIDMVYVCRPLSQGIVIQTEEVGAYVWVPIEDIGTLSTPPELHALVAAAAKYANGLSYGV